MSEWGGTSVSPSHRGTLESLSQDLTGLSMQLSSQRLLQELLLLLHLDVSKQLLWCASVSVRG